VCLGFCVALRDEDGDALKWSWQGHGGVLVCQLASQPQNLGLRPANKACEFDVPAGGAKVC